MSNERINAPCEGCEASAETRLGDGAPVCWECRIARERDCAYADGFEDGVNDAAPGLIEAAKAAVQDPSLPNLARLHYVVAEYERLAA